MEVIRLLRRRPWGIAGAVVLLVVILIAILSPVITPYHFNEIYIDHRMESPGSGHILGTDQLGRDVFSRLLYGSRPYVGTGLVATGTAAVIGLLLGFIFTISRNKMKKSTEKILRLIFFSLAAIAILIVLIIILTFIFRLTHFYFLGIIRITSVHAILIILCYGLLLSLIFLPSVYTVTRKVFTPALGKKRFGTFWHELIPLLLVNLGIATGVALLIIAPMGFYGFGIPPPIPEWGHMLSGFGLRYFSEAPWMAVTPAIAIAITLIGLILFGTASREIWLPRLSESGKVAG
ncbi:ABC transporter permease [Chloroflexota bacterium]